MSWVRNKYTGLHENGVKKVKMAIQNSGQPNLVVSP